MTKVINNEEENRHLAIQYALNLFHNTDFKKMLVNSTNPLQVNDASFYAIVEELTSYLNTGKFPNFEVFKKSQKKAA